MFASQFYSWLHIYRSHVLRSKYVQATSKPQLTPVVMLCAVNNWMGCNRAAVGAYEMFEVVYLGNNQFALKGGD